MIYLKFNEDIYLLRNQMLEVLVLSNVFTVM